MGAAAARTSSVSLAKIVKPHIPLIKFPLRGPAPVLKEIVTPNAGKPAASNPAINTAVTNEVPSTASKRSTGSAIDSSELPQKYRRKPISKEEMEFIEKGGSV